MGLDEVFEDECGDISRIFDSSTHLTPSALWCPTSTWCQGLAIEHRMLEVNFQVGIFDFSPPSTSRLPRVVRQNYELNSVMQTIVLVDVFFGSTRLHLDLAILKLIIASFLLDETGLRGIFFLFHLFLTFSLSFFFFASLRGQNVNATSGDVRLRAYEGF